MMYYFSVLLSGILFGVGLTVSQMINANKVLNFLDITGKWDASLLFVMLGAVSVTGIGYTLIKKLPHPLYAGTFSLPQKISIDAKLIVGSAIFGIGWGLAGYCPGPGTAALGLGIVDALYFMIGMLVSVILTFKR